MRDGSSDDESPPPVSRRGRAAAKKPESEMTTVEKHVARMLAANAAVEMETARQAHRAETLRRTGESALVALGDLDVDSDSETEDDTSAGFTGKARREVRCRRRVSRHEDENENEDEHEDVFRVSIRALSARELGMTYAWMRRDQARYENAVKFWDNASSSIQAAWEETDAPGEPCVRAAISEAADVFASSSLNSRVLGAFCPKLGPAPVGFCVLKHDALTVDALGIRQGLRMCGFGRGFVEVLVRRAKSAAAKNAGPPELVIDALPASVQVRLFLTS